MYEMMRWRDRVRKENWKEENFYSKFADQMWVTSIKVLPVQIVCEMPPSVPVPVPALVLASFSGTYS